MFIKDMALVKRFVGYGRRPWEPRTLPLDLISCPAGKDLPSPAYQAPALGQAYPRSIPGRLSSLASSPTDVDLNLAGHGTGTLDVWIPGVVKPSAIWSGLRDVTITARPGGGWRLTGTAAGSYRLNVFL